jgi:hypothetical protein
MRSELINSLKSQSPLITQNNMTLQKEVEIHPEQTKEEMGEQIESVPNNQIQSISPHESKTNERWFPKI